MKDFLAIFVSISIFLVIVIRYADTTRGSLSFALGALIVLGNVLVTAWAWRLIFRKKLVALASGVIVFKYAILGTIIYLLVRSGKISVAWMAAGLSVLLPAVLGYALLQNWRTKDE